MSGEHHGDALPLVLDERSMLDTGEFARACGTSVAIVEELVVEGVLVRSPGTEGFSGAMVARVRRVLGLQRAFDAPLGCALVMLDLLEEIERLRTLTESAPSSTAMRTDV